MAHEHESHETHHVNYLMVFGALCFFTLLSIVFDVFDIRGLAAQAGMNGTIVLIVLVIAVACAKALCVMMFFMHLKFEGNWKYVLLAPTTILAIGLPLALLPDVGVHYYTNDPQYEIEAPSMTHHGDAEEAHAPTADH